MNIIMTNTEKDYELNNIRISCYCDTATERLANELDNELVIMLRDYDVNKHRDVKEID